MQRRSLLLALAGTCSTLLAACMDRKAAFKSVDITGADYARDFQLPDIDGKVRSIKDFAGRAVIVFFGYTQCPDVCPTTLADIAQAKKLLGDDGAKVQGIFITIDPERDTPQLLKAYMANFGPDFIALRGSPEQLSAVAKDFKVYYKKVESQGGGYTMDHTAASYVYDAKGNLRLYTRYGSGPQPLADDLKLLLQA